MGTKIAANGTTEIYDALPIPVWRREFVGEIVPGSGDYTLTQYEAAFVMVARYDEEGTFTFQIPDRAYPGNYHEYTVTVERNYHES